MAAFASPRDVEDTWRPLSVSETGITDALLERASNIVRLRVPGVAARQAADTVYAATLRAVVADMVLRVLKNPDGKRQESVDDYSWTRDTVVSAGLLQLTDEELALLSPSTVGLGGAFVVSLGG